LVDWTRLRRRNWSDEVEAKGCHVFACGDERQAVVWLLRQGALGSDGRMRGDIPASPVEVVLPLTGKLRARAFDTVHGVIVGEWVSDGEGRFSAPIAADQAFAIEVVD